jgi:sporulation protein YlmC with PRC-barrel domain
MSDSDGVGTIDAVLHLMDRQVVDRDGRMVCKVDDLELTERQDGTWEVTALLAGASVLIPRLGGRLGDGLEEYWRRLGLQEADRLVPWRIGMSLVGELGSGIRLVAAREQLLLRQTDSPAAEGATRRRVNDVLQLHVLGRDAERLGSVLDLRLHRDSDEPLRLLVDGLVVGPRRPGRNLGYDRHTDQGPWVLNRLVHHLQRHSHYVSVHDIGAIDWIERELRLVAAPRPLVG